MRIKTKINTLFWTLTEKKRARRQEVQEVQEEEEEGHRAALPRPRHSEAIR